MPTWKGRFNNLGSPIISITISGPDGGMSYRVDAIVDTGFNGFLALPVAYARNLGLTTTSVYTLGAADDAAALRPGSKGRIGVEGEEFDGDFLILDNNLDCFAIGVEFLRITRRRLEVSIIRDEIILIEE